jgi:hypothetical protein
LGGDGVEPEWVAEDPGADAPDAVDLARRPGLPRPELPPRPVALDVVLVRQRPPWRESPPSSPVNDQRKATSARASSSTSNRISSAVFGRRKDVACRPSW